MHFIKNIQWISSTDFSFHRRNVFNCATTALHTKTSGSSESIIYSIWPNGYATLLELVPTFSIRKSWLEIIILNCTDRLLAHQIITYVTLTSCNRYNILLKLLICFMLSNFKYEVAGMSKGWKTSTGYLRKDVPPTTISQRMSSCTLQTLKLINNE